MSVGRGRTPIWFHPSIAPEDIDNALASVGITVRSDASHRLVADRIPDMLKKPENVVKLKKVGS